MRNVSFQGTLCRSKKAEVLIWIDELDQGKKLPLPSRAIIAAIIGFAESSISRLSGLAREYTFGCRLVFTQDNEIYKKYIDVASNLRPGSEFGS